MRNVPPKTVGQLAAMVQGKVVGDTDKFVHDALPVHDANCNCITLLDGSRKLHDLLRRSRVAAIVAPIGFPETDVPIIEVANPHQAFESIVHYFRPTSSIREQGVHHAAIVHESTSVGQDAAIHAGVVIGPDCVIGNNCTVHCGVTIMAGCRIGDGCTIYPSVVLYPDTILHDRVLIHSGSVLGAFGFGYRSIDGRSQRTAQLGWVEIESDVEIGAAVTIDRGTYGATFVGEGTKIDNQVMIGHNCRIGKHNLICAQAGIAGSSSTGDHVVLAGQVGIKDHVHIGDRAVIAAQSGIISDVRPGEVMLGSPASPKKDQMQFVAVQNRLPELRRQLRTLQNEVDSLKQLLGDRRAA